MNRKLIPYVALLAAFGLGACSDNSIAVTNPNAGDTKRVLGTPDDAEKLLGSYYKRWYQGLYGGAARIPRRRSRAWRTSCPCRTTRA